MACHRDMKFNCGLMRFRVILEIWILMFFKKFAIFGAPSGSDIQRGLLRCKVILQMWFRFSGRIYVFFFIPSGSEIQRWLVANLRCIGRMLCRLSSKATRNQCGNLLLVRTQFAEHWHQYTTLIWNRFWATLDRPGCGNSAEMIATVRNQCGRPCLPWNRNFTAVVMWKQ